MSVNGQTIGPSKSWLWSLDNWAVLAALAAALLVRAGVFKHIPW